MPANKIQITWSRRLLKGISIDEGAYICYSSVDCTDMSIFEPMPFDPGWRSHKTNGPAVRYEVALSLSGDIVWMHGPFQAGRNPDLTIFRKALKEKLNHNELVIADGVYVDLSCTYNEGLSESLAQRIRSRHETLFTRFKSFNILTNRFRHGLEKHSDCFFAIGNLVQLSIENGDTLFDLE